MVRSFHLFVSLPFTLTNRSRRGIIKESNSNKIKILLIMLTTETTKT